MPRKQSPIYNLPKQEFLNLYSEIFDRFPQFNHFETVLCAYKALGFSQGEIACYFGVNQSTISRTFKSMHKKVS
ncbi:MAG: winged helix-turn-helix domain-containing protein [Candidatus Aminicenantes bacterium]|nr:winged helix-turn-helix domain-containing protein [Candidatus Aminicenantes bacterium]